MIDVIARLINFLADAITLVVIVDIILSYLLSPYHPIRNALDRIVDPLLSPIRKILPAVGMFDFSPMVLIILVWILSFILVNILYLLR